MRYLDVCAGISASTVAWRDLGWQAAAYSEIEPAPRAILAHHYPETPLHGDFTTIEGNEYGPIDLLVGGTPCQDFSIAGLRAGLDGDRGNLSLEFLRLADRTRPRWLVWENVPGVLSIDGGRAFGAILGGMGELGYGFAYRVLDAQHFGVPQRRRRVFVVGYLGDWRRAGAVLFERHSLSGHSPPRRQTGQNPARSLSASPSSNRSPNEDCNLIPSTGHTAHCLNAGGMGRQDYETETLIAHALRGEGFDASEDGTGRATPLVPVAFVQNSRDEVRLFGEDGQTVGALAAEPGMKQQSYICFSAKDHGADAMHDLSPTLRAGGHSGSHANAGVMPAVTVHAFDARQSDVLQYGDKTGPMDTGLPGPAAMIGSAVRRLTPRECERLQGFPDDYTLVPYRKGMMADGPRYKALGNSMAVPVMRWIGERIAAVDALQERDIAA